MKHVQKSIYLNHAGFQEYFSLKTALIRDVSGAQAVLHPSMSVWRCAKYWKITFILTI